MPTDSSQPRSSNIIQQGRQDVTLHLTYRKGKVIDVIVKEFTNHLKHNPSEKCQLHIADDKTAANSEKLSVVVAFVTAEDQQYFRDNFKEAVSFDEKLVFVSFEPNVVASLESWLSELIAEHTLVTIDLTAKRSEEWVKIVTAIDDEIAWNRLLKLAKPAKIVAEMVNMTGYLDRPKLKADLRHYLRQFAFSECPVMVVHGECGVGKTWLLRHVLDETYVGRCGFAEVVWLNVRHLTKWPRFDKQCKETFYLQLANKILENHSESQTLSPTIRNLLNQFLNNSDGKILLVADEVCNNDFLSFVGHLSHNVKAICISTKDYHNSDFKIAFEPSFKVDDMEKKSIEKILLKYCEDNLAVQKLVPFCRGRPLLAEVLGSAFRRSRNPKRYVDDLTLLDFSSKNPMKGQSTHNTIDPNEEYIWKALFHGAKQEEAELRRRYYYLLLFENNCGIELGDVKILWQCGDEDARKTVQLFLDISLVEGDVEQCQIRSIFVQAALFFLLNVEMDNKDLREGVLTFLSDQNKALLQFRANLLRKSQFSILEKSVQENRLKLLQAIMEVVKARVDSALIKFLCLQQSKSLLHTMLENKLLAFEGTDSEIDLSFTSACYLVDRLLPPAPEFDKDKTQKLISEIEGVASPTVFDLLLESSIRNVPREETELSSFRKIGAKLYHNALLVSAVDELLALTHVICGISVEQIADTVDSDGNNAVILAVKHGRVKALKELLRRRRSILKPYIDVNAKNQRGETALLVATSMQSIEAIDYLLGAGANVAIGNNDGTTPVMIAVELNNETMLTKLATSDSHEPAELANLTDGLGNSALWLAVIRRNIDLVDRLLRKYGATLSYHEIVLLKRILKRNEYRKLRSRIETNHGLITSFSYFRAENALLRFLKIDESRLFEDDTDDTRKEKRSILAAIANERTVSVFHSAYRKFRSDSIPYGLKQFVDAIVLISCFLDKPEVIRSLFEAETNEKSGITFKNTRNLANETPLILAVEFGKPGVVEELLRKEYEIDICAWGNDGVTALMKSCQKGSTIVKLLSDSLRSSSNNVNARDKDGRSALMKACISGSIYSVEKLLEFGSRRVEVNASDNDGKTALMFACGNEEADVRFEPLLKALVENKNFPVDLDAKDNDDTTALMYAARKGNDDAIKALLEFKCDINAKDKDGRSALTLASRLGRKKAVGKLMGNSNTDVNSSDNDGWTALMHACQYGHESVAGLLAGSSNVASEINKTESKGWTCLTIAARYGQDQIVKLLLSKCKSLIDVNLNDPSGKTAFMYACIYGHWKVVKTLLSLPNGKIDVNKQDKDGRTALMYACFHGQDIIVKMLVDNKVHKADISLSCKGNKTAYDLAMDGDHRNIARLVKQRKEETLRRNDSWSSGEENNGETFRKPDKRFPSPALSDSSFNAIPSEPIPA